MSERNCENEMTGISQIGRRRVFCRSSRNDAQLASTSLCIYLILVPSVTFLVVKLNV